MDSNKINFSVHSMNDAPEIPKIGSRMAGTYWTWGNDNKLPAQLYDYYEESGLHGAIVKSKLAYVKGRGLKIDESLPEELKTFVGSCNRHGDTLEDILARFALDVLIYGAGALNVVWSVASEKIAELYYIDVAQLRYNKEKDGMIYSDDWSRGARGKTTNYPLFDLNDKKGSQVYHFTLPESKFLYGSPSYSGSIPDIIASINISKFHAAKTVHPLQSDLFIEFKGAIPEEEEKVKIESGFKKKFSGVNNAGNSIAFGYATDSEHETRIEAIQTGDPEGKRYLALREEIKISIVSGHQLPSTSLVAIPSSGLVFDSAYAESLNIFQNVVIIPLQDEIMKPINKLLSINFGKVDMKLLPLPIIKSNLSNEQFIYENMTTEEVRKDMEKAGRIESAEYVQGSLIKEQRGENTGSIDQAIISTIKKTQENAA